MRIALVSCVKTKRATRAAAKDLYTSAWFRAARRFAESNSERWFILSAEYGLLSPEDLIDPYERTLNRMGVKERRAWAMQVCEKMEQNVERGSHVIVLAGERYREFLVPRLKTLECEVEIPMLGLPQGRQLQWLNGKNRG